MACSCFDEMFLLVPASSDLPSEHANAEVEHRPLSLPCVAGEGRGGGSLNQAEIPQNLLVGAGSTQINLPILGTRTSAKNY